MQHVLILRCMYVPVTVTLGPWGVPSDVIRKRRARVVWLHGLCPRAYRVVIYMVYARVAWLHGLRLCTYCVVTWFSRWTATAVRSWQDFVSENTRTTCRYLDRVKMNVAPYRVWPDPRASTL